ncbi:unnamed protein product [Pleuronectes platessa]|uniref:Uncharacterized protein n=1 Tax=Pleuronectes platessa TaxID=8262 RepID=A0A9N7U709_PLEPL|nr:unnamed protein product [Pleuronectes platessa]
MSSSRGQGSVSTSKDEIVGPFAKEDADEPPPCRAQGTRVMLSRWGIIAHTWSVAQALNTTPAWPPKPDSAKHLPGPAPPPPLWCDPEKTSLAASYLLEKHGRSQRCHLWVHKTSGGSHSSGNFPIFSRSCVWIPANQ